MSPYTPHARIIVEEVVQGHAHEPIPDQLEKIEAYREAYLRTFDVYPAGSHWGRHRWENGPAAPP